jgi:hypothetical protein
MKKKLRNKDNSRNKPMVHLPGQVTSPLEDELLKVAAVAQALMKLINLQMITLIGNRDGRTIKMTPG